MKTLNQMGAHFFSLSAGRFRASLIPALKLIGTEVKHEVEQSIGEYQGAIGPFGPTEPLAQSTLERKARGGWGKGGEPDSPLWATGDFHDSIKIAMHPVELSVEIGTDLEYIVDQELGTGTMPPRATFGPAALRAAPKIKPIIATAVGCGLAGGVLGSVGVATSQAGGQGTGGHLL